MVSSADALARLRDGNRRFVENASVHRDTVDRSHGPELAAGQSPFAIVLACSDSRVPVELVFDQGFGDLFVIRVAGNIVAPSQIGSVEFAAQQFGTKLVVVLGHSGCGAVVATLKELTLKESHRSPNLRAIVDRVKPAVEPVLARHGNEESDATVNDAVRANIHASVDQLAHGSSVLEQLVERGELAIVGAEYTIETGQVEFFDESDA